MLTPVLQPPEVKEYLSKGERFIKWDDVSTIDFLSLCFMYGDGTDTVFWSGAMGRLGACIQCWGWDMECCT